MNMKEYQEKASRTASFVDVKGEHVYPIIGLAGEVGELLNKVKKIHRDKQGQVDQETKDGIAGELGDILWYVSEVARQFDLDLDDVAQKNIDKLAKRLKENKIHGDGDNR